MKALKMLSLASILLLTYNAKAQTPTENQDITLKNGTGKAPIGNVYFGNSLDGMIFSTALINNNGTKSMGTLRFTAWFHVGFTFNYNFSKSVGIYTGLDIKNIGFIEKFKLDNTTIKQRVYTVGIPLGLRLGNMQKKNYIFLGAGADLAAHYKNKYWSNSVKKTKYNDWFSDQTESILPYAFLGIAKKGYTLKVQYYFSNFLNEDYTVMGIKPNARKEVNLLLFSLGRDITYKKK